MTIAQPIYKGKISLDSLLEGAKLLAYALARSCIVLFKPKFQDENSEPPIPGMEDSSMPEEPVMSITEQVSL